MGWIHHIQQSTNYTAGNWQTNLSVTLTNDPQMMSLPVPTSQVNFWRVLVALARKAA